MEEERAKRDPWLLSPAVVEAEKKLEELKEARRDANAKLEFDLSTQLTKDISAQERAVKKAIKAAKKEYKKSGKVPTSAPDADKSDDVKSPDAEGKKDPPTKEKAKAEDGELKKLKEELVKVSKEKK